MRLHSIYAAVATAALTFALPDRPHPAFTPTLEGGDGPAVYLKLVDGSPVPFEQATAALTDALRRNGWTVVAEIPTSVDADKCSFRSDVVVAYDEAYAQRVMAAGTHAAFAVPLRFVVWEDENGVSVGATNPMNLNRTIVDEATSPEDWAGVAAEVRAVAEAAFPGKTVQEEYGQKRGKARIGRTMGIMAGGKFTDKVESIATLPGDTTDPGAVARLLAERIPALEGRWEWGTRPVYVLDLPEAGVALVGMAGAKMEVDAFNIVKHGGDGARKHMACPGIDHAAAFPVELLVSREGDEIHVSLVDEMYRMKMFFEDAGKMAFAKNMGMPGSIEDELKKKVEAALR